MRGFGGRLPWSCQQTVLWKMDDLRFMGAIPAPEGVMIPKIRYWAYYDKMHGTFIITGTQLSVYDPLEKIKIVNKEDALSPNKSNEAGLILGNWNGRNTPLK